MSLKDRLDRLTGDGAKPTPPDPQQERIAELRRRLDRALARRETAAPARAPATGRHAIPLDQLVDGEEVRTPQGAFFVSRNRMKAGDVHGHARICDVACAPMEAAAIFAGLRMAPETVLEDGLFLDTETTGLMGGTGTFPFLIGLGWFEANSFVTCQLFARDFSEEGAVLTYLSELASDKKFLVTFNGKAYDLNLLTARFILNRCRDTLTSMPHIDLLHPSRRILAHRLENARLSTIETYVLGVEREEDVPGFEIPQRYFDWLRRRDGRLLADVFTHNRLDVVSMAALLKYLTDLVDENNNTEGGGHHGDLLRVAELIHERGDLGRAETMFQGLTSSHHEDVATRARESLSLIYKKARRWEEASVLWQGLIESHPRNLFAVEELAKYYEHHAREWGKALELVDKFLNDSRHLSDVERTSVERRLQRLRQKTSGGGSS